MKNFLTNKNLIENIFLKNTFIVEDEVFLDNKLIKIYLTKFWDEIMNNLDKDQIVLLLFRIRLGDEDDPTVFGHYVTIGNLFKINNSKTDFIRLYEHLKALLSIKDQSYKSLPLMEVVFSYKIIPLDNNKISKVSTIKKLTKPKAKTYKFKGYNLPNTMSLKLWGKELFTTNNNLKINKKGSQYIYDVEIIDNENKPLTYNVSLQLPKSKGNFLSFTDVINKEFNNLNSFTRYIGSNEYYFVDGELVLRLNPRKTSFLEVVNLYKNKFGKKIVPQLDNKFITLDMETQVINGIIKPILISIYDGVRHYNFYLPDFNNEKEMILSALNNLLNPKYNKYKVYVHNLSHFDGVFLMRYLVNLKYDEEEVFIKPTIKDGKMINLDLKFGKYKISFRDSLLIFLASLKKLALAFGVGEKGNIDYKSVDNLSIVELNEYSLRNELINYASLDCKLLYDILIKFNELIFDKWNLNVNNYPTLPSIAYGLFRSKYIKNDVIPNITGQPYLDIKNSYTGGSVDMIIPHGKNIYYYDINSLYPYVMMMSNMPVGNMKSFEGNVFRVNPEAFGFFECIVNTPKELNVPILQIHNKGRTISPLGTFKGWFFSEELKYARDNFSYDFEILRGYIFDQENLFDQYVNDLYNLRLTYDKSNPMNYIAKILMNSLYGRFGLNPLLPENLVIDKDELDGFVDTSEIYDLIDLDNKFLIQFLNKNKIEKFKLLSFAEEIKSNIAIASATTAYSRMVLAEIKKYCSDNDVILYYFDTDSVFINKPLPDHLVGKNIGQWKLESLCKEAVFIAPKVYGYIDYNGNEVVKCKGFKNKITFEEMKSLLNENVSLKLNHEKWFRSLSRSYISLQKSPYQLIPTQNKRKLIYEKGRAMNSHPFKIPFDLGFKFAITNKIFD